jgi:hypothetical protein
MARKDPIFTDRREIFGVYGETGAGKSSFAASLSQYWPSDAFTRAKKGGTKINLADCYPLLADADGLAALSTKGITMPHYDLLAVMTERDTWQAVGLRAQPSFWDAVMHYPKVLAKRVQSGETTIGGVDTVSGLDPFLFDACAHASPPGDTRALFGLMLRRWRELHIALRLSRAVLVYQFHTRAVDPTTQSDGAQAKNSTVLAIGGAHIMPDVQGSGPKIFYRDSTQIFYLRATLGKAGVQRTVLTRVNDLGCMVKNRYEDALDPVEPPDFRAILTKVRKVQAQWR